MATENLFAAPPQDPNGGRSIVRFKCGRMKNEDLPDGTCRVTALPARGYLELLTADGRSSSSWSSGGGTMFRLVWSSRSGTVPQDADNSLLLLPREQSFEKVNTGVLTDRVFLLRFLNSTRKVFFWVQEPDAEGDEAILKKVRDALGCEQTDALNDALFALLGDLSGGGDAETETATGADGGATTSSAPGTDAAAVAGAAPETAAPAPAANGGGGDQVAEEGGEGGEGGPNGANGQPREEA
jgi:hypothetical protein